MAEGISSKFIGTCETIPLSRRLSQVRLPTILMLRLIYGPSISSSLPGVSVQRARSFRLHKYLIASNEPSIMSHGIASGSRVAHTIQSATYDSTRPEHADSPSSSGLPCLPTGESSSVPTHGVPTDVVIKETVELGHEKLTSGYSAFFSQPQR